MFSFQQDDGAQRKGGRVNFRLKARDLPGRVAAGGYILHAGLGVVAGTAATKERRRRANDDK
jgi:hypothetical protein